MMQSRLDMKLTPKLVIRSTCFSHTGKGSNVFKKVTYHAPAKSVINF